MRQAEYRPFRSSVRSWKSASALKTAGSLAIPRFTFVIAITTARVIILFSIARPPTGAIGPQRSDHKFCQRTIASLRASRILRRAAATPRSRILANAAEALFLTDEKRHAAAVSSITVQMQLLSFRANARAAQEGRYIYSPLRAIR